MNPPQQFSGPLSTAEQAPAGAADATLTEVIATLRKRKWVILAALVLGTIYGLYKAHTQPRIYVSAGTIQLRTGSSNEYRLATAQVGENASTHLLSEVSILKSASLLLHVAEDLDLANNPQVTGNHHQPPHQITNPTVRQMLLGYLFTAVNVTTIPKTDLISIECTTGNPQLSASIVNTLVADYITRSSQVRVDFTERVAQDLEPNLVHLKTEVEALQQRVIDLQKKVGVVSLDSTHNELASTLDDLSRASAEAEIARILAQSRYHVLSNMDPASLDSSVDANLGGATPLAGVLSGLRTQLTSLQTQVALLKTYEGSRNPQMVALNNQIATVQKAIQSEQDRLVEQARETLRAAQTNEQQTRSAFEGQRQDAYQRRDDLVQLTLAERQFDTERTLYEGLESRLQTAAISAGLESNEIDVVDQALPPVAPTLKPRSSILILTTIISLAFGIGLAFLLEALDTNLRSVAELEAVSGLPSLALIPRSRRSDTAVAEDASPTLKNLQVMANPKSQFAESFRSLRTSLLLSTAGHPPKVILLTSATPSEGKTTVSINLAAVLSQRDVRVLLIDADLRRPSVHHRFGLNGRLGLTTVLTGAATLEEAVQRVPELPKLDILASGPVPPFPTEMVGSETMLALLEKCAGIYTHIVIDSPPVLSVTDGVVLARSADAVVLIVRHGKPSKHLVKRARDLLVRAGAHLSGIVLNSVDLNSPEYYGYYGYYGYSGYSYAGTDSSTWKPGEDSPGTGRGKSGRRKPGNFDPGSSDTEGDS